MQVWRGGTSCAAGAAYDGATPDFRADCNNEAGKMSVMSGHSAAVINDNQIPVAAVPSRKFNNACLACAYGVAPGRFDVDPRVKSGAPRERVNAIAEGTADFDAAGNHRTLFILRFGLGCRAGFIGLCRN